jgi:diguanylate cyclase (GGDEF)-like protein/PAS domain S-box-containing protein
VFLKLLTKGGIANPAAIPPELSVVLQRSARAEYELAALRRDSARLAARFDLVRGATNDGLWDMEANPADPVSPDNPFWWSDQFRRLLGFSDETDFPNVLGSWSARLHPDDAAPTLAAFAAHITDRSGRTPYDVTYRLQCRNGEYRWFSAHGKTTRAADGSPLRVAGSLSDITDQNTILDLKRYAEDIVANLPAGLLVVDEALRVLTVNRSFLDIFGLASSAEVSGRKLDALLAQPEVTARVHEVLAGGAGADGIEVALDDKRLRLAIACTGRSAEQRRLLVVVEDVTGAQRLRDEAFANLIRYRNQAALLDQATDAIIVIGIDNRIIFWNKGAERLYGWSAAEAVGELSNELTYQDPTALERINGRIFEHGRWRGEVSQRHKDGSTFIVESQRTLVKSDNDQGQSVFIINTDITQRKADEERIRRMALYDSLTSLPNRSLFMDRMKHALVNCERNSHSLALLFVDLNHFKEINDTHGHDVGDKVLIEVARRFQAVLRADETLARLAGDEFVVIAESTDDDTAKLVGERLLQALTPPIEVQRQGFAIRASIGTALYPQDGVTIEDLLKRADIAMYQAKALGGGHVAYQEYMSVGLAERMEIAESLGLAIGAGRLELYYQPKIHLQTGRLNGAEALLRWNDPQRGWISPATFIPIAEARGLIGGLGKWVLQEACRQLNAWRAAGRHFPGRLAVNLAAQQLEEPDLVDEILAIVHAAGLTPACFELELTESGLMGNVQHAIAVMTALKAAGFSLSIDDFGTGYSSLSYLKRLPADTLKIDIAFVRDMLVDHHDYTIVTTIIGMAGNLGLKVIAEGVEEAAQAAALLKLGCDDAQGYHFSRPVPANDFAMAWLVTPISPQHAARSASMQG